MYHYTGTLADPGISELTLYVNIQQNLIIKLNINSGVNLDFLPRGKISITGSTSRPEMSITYKKSKFSAASELHSLFASDLAETFFCLVLGY